MNLDIALLWAILFFFQVAVPGPALENDFVRVTRDQSPCADGAPSCGERVLVALGDLSLNDTKMHRGDIKVFKTGQRYTAPTDGEYLEVSIKPNHPKVAALPTGTPAAPENKVLYDSRDFTVFTEKMTPGEVSSVHSHNVRVAIFLDRTQVEQWDNVSAPPTTKGNIRELVPDEVMWRPAVVHVSKDVGEFPINNLLIEFNPSK
jgi:hypothetical protein